MFQDRYKGHDRKPPSGKHSSFDRHAERSYDGHRADERGRRENQGGSLKRKRSGSHTHSDSGSHHRPGSREDFHDHKPFHRSSPYEGRGGSSDWENSGSRGNSQNNSSRRRSRERDKFVESRGAVRNHSSSPFKRSSDPSPSSSESSSDDRESPGRRSVRTNNQRKPPPLSPLSGEDGEEIQGNFHGRHVSSDEAPAVPSRSSSPEPPKVQSIPRKKQPKAQGNSFAEQRSAPESHPTKPHAVHPKKRYKENQQDALPMPEKINLDDLRSSDAIFLKGKLQARNGVHTINGKWAMSFRDFSGGGIKSDFQYKMDSSKNEVPQTGNYEGYFKMKENGKTATFKDNKLFLKFEKYDATSYNIKGSGNNTFGTFLLQGHITSNVEISMYRIYQTNIPSDFCSDTVQRSNLNTTTSKDRTAQKPPAPKVMAIPPDVPDVVPNVPKRPVKIPPEDNVNKIPKLQNDAIGKAKLLDIMKKLTKEDAMSVFAEPVDPVACGVPQYFDIIKHPMDFGTIKQKLKHNKYGSRQEFVSDIKLTFGNALKFNVAEGDAVRSTTLKLQDIFKRVYAKTFPNDNIKELYEDDKPSKIQPEPSPTTKPTSEPPKPPKVKKKTEETRKKQVPENIPAEEHRESKSKSKIQSRGSTASKDPATKQANDRIKDVQKQLNKKKAHHIPTAAKFDDDSDSSDKPIRRTEIKVERSPVRSPTPARIPSPLRPIKVKKVHLKVEEPPPEPLPPSNPLNTIPLTFEEKAELTYLISEDVDPELKNYLQTLKTLTEDELEQVSDLLTKAASFAQSSEEVELEIDSLPISTLREAQELMDGFQKQHENESGLVYYRKAKELLHTPVPESKIKIKPEPMPPVVVPDLKPIVKAEPDLKPIVKPENSPGYSSSDPEPVKREPEMSITTQEPVKSEPVPPDLPEEPEEPPRSPIPIINPMYWENFSSVGVRPSLFRGVSQVKFNELWMSARNDRQQWAQTEKEIKKQEHLRLEFQRFKDSLAIEKAEEHRREASERKTMQREEEEQRKREAADKLWRRRQEERERIDSIIQHLDLFENHFVMDVEFIQNLRIDRSDLFGRFYEMGKAERFSDPGESP